MLDCNRSSLNPSIFEMRYCTGSNNKLVAVRRGEAVSFHPETGGPRAKIFGSILVPPPSNYLVRHWNISKTTTRKLSWSFPSRNYEVVRLVSTFSTGPNVKKKKRKKKKENACTCTFRRWQEALRSSWSLLLHINARCAIFRASRKRGNVSSAMLRRSYGCRTVCNLVIRHGNRRSAGDTRASAPLKIRSRQSWNLDGETRFSSVRASNCFYVFEKN